MTNDQLKLPINPEDSKEQIEKIIALSKCSLLYYSDIRDSFSNSGIVAEYIGYEELDHYNDLKCWLMDYDWDVKAVLKAWHNDPYQANLLHPGARSLVCTEPVSLSRKFHSSSLPDIEDKEEPQYFRHVSNEIPEDFNLMIP